MRFFLTFILAPSLIYGATCEAAHVRETGPRLQMQQQTVIFLRGVGADGMPYRIVTWARSPSLEEVARHSHLVLTGSGYVGVVCRRATMEHLSDCVVDQSDPDDPTLKAAALYAATRFRKMITGPKLKSSGIKAVRIDFQFSAPGYPADNRLHCLPPFCQIEQIPTPPPPPPPPAPQRHEN